jgi:lipoate-protein ligase A
MGTDEILFHEIDRTGDGFFRMHAFQEPSSTLGYFQSAPRKPDTPEPWTRRLTGGGTVRHDRDVILSLGFSSPRSRGETGGTLYERIHRLFKEAFDVLIPEIEMVPDSPGPRASTRRYRCFEHPVPHDLVRGNVKILGGAVRRRKDAVLYQGAVRHAPLRDDSGLRRRLFDLLSETLPDGFGAAFRRVDFPEKSLRLARELSERRYRSLNWKRKF